MSVSPSHAAIPGNTADYSISLVYIGESASLSYLQIIRRSVVESIGSCAFADDPLQQQIYEKEAERPLGTHLEPETQPDLAWCLDLVAQFHLQVSGTLDLFDSSWIEGRLPQWIADQNRRDRPESPIIFQVLAIGILSKATTHQEETIAESHFNYGRQLAFIHLMDEPSLLTVQAFCLIGWYMIISCRRNGAFAHLGIAARAAYALGIHRHETNRDFVCEAGIERERAWKSLRVCDLFLCASMGRPPATSENGCNITETAITSTRDRASALASCQVSSAMFRICHVFERILVEMYANREVSLDLAHSISQQHRQWATQLPSILKIDGLSKGQPIANAPTQSMGSRMLTMAYYYSILLLSRPFLSIDVGAHQSQVIQKQSQDIISKSITIYADACVDSAVKAVALGSNVALDESMPRRQPLVIDTVFLSALALGHAYLGDYDQRGWPIGRWLDSAVSTLRHLSAGSAHAARYYDICCGLKDAVEIYTQRRADTFLKSTTQHVRHVFGDVQQDDCQGHRERSSYVASGDLQREIHEEMGHQATTICPGHRHFPPESQIMPDEQTIRQFHGAQDLCKDHASSKRGGSINRLSPMGLNDFPFTEDVPLFSLMDEIGGIYPMS